MKLIYFVHDLSHADIARRAQMLEQGGAEIIMLGFHRKANFDTSMASKVIGVGQTVDGNFIQRVVSVIKAMMELGQYAEAIRGADAIMARNLEMLILSAFARWRYLPKAPLTYECLDIHRLMTGGGAAGAVLRFIEGALIKRCHAIVTSSPGFVREYFERLYPNAPQMVLAENKVYPEQAEGRPEAQLLPPPKPWRIGWFGVIRCKRSLDILSAIARSAPGLIEVVVAGRPAKAVFGDIDAAFSNIPGVNYIGGFADEAELARLFQSVHFAWAMDFFEAGSNSDWLLPNRLYRSIYYGAVPIALSTVETGRWLQNHQAGLLVDQAEPEILRAALEQLSAANYAGLQAALKRIPDAAIVTEDAECRAFVKVLAGG